MNDNIKERVLKSIRAYYMVKPGDVVMAAVSGGPDSVCLLQILAALKNKLKIRDIIVCNLDHGLRGEESREDSAFVKKLASGLRLKFIHKKVNLKKFTRDGLSPEERARAERYKFFFDAARKTGANVVATGHTLDDQAETILMRLIKGASLKGIVGIAPAREERGLRIIRPLIELEKSEIAAHLDASGIDYRTDSSNFESIYFRNIVRRDIIPYLEKYNPKLKRVLFNLAEHLREDFEFIDREKSKVRDTIVRIGDKHVEISLKDIIVQPRAIQKEVIRDSLEKAGGEVKKLSFRHWKEIEALIARGRKSNAVDLPGDIRISRSHDMLIFKKR